MEEEAKLKRRRTTATRRWRDFETEALLQSLLKTVKPQPESFEKPTAQIFYDNLTADVPNLRHFTWQALKSKIRYLRSTHNAAALWMSTSGAGLVAKGFEKAAQTKVLRMCPHWQILGNIFGEQKFTPVTQEREVECTIALEDDNSNATDFGESSETDQRPASTGSSTPLSKRGKRTDLFASLITVQEKKLELELKKYELEKQKQMHLLEFKKLELQQQLEITKLKIASEEKLKKYELDLKYKQLEREERRLSQQRPEIVNAKREI